MQAATALLFHHRDADVIVIRVLFNRTSEGVSLKEYLRTVD